MSQTTPALFTPFTLKDVSLRNRIAVPPMCMFKAVDGYANDWHLSHYAGLADGGPGLVIVEATAVSPEGRITPGCLGLWDDAHIPALARIAKAIKERGAVPGIQIAHAGRKANANVPWEGDNHIAEGDPRAWEIIAPSPVAFGGHLPRVPREMTHADIARVAGDFAAAARRAREAGFEWLELHFAHGYLAQSFLSVHANKRTDEYGGDARGRGRFLEETLAKVRVNWPSNLPLTARVGVIEFDGRDEQTLSESIELLRRLHKGGLDFVNVSMGFSTREAKIPWGPAMLAPTTAKVRSETGLPVAAAWGFANPRAAEKAISEGTADLVMIGRANLLNPHWTLQAARELGLERAAWVLPAPYAHWLDRYQLD